MEEMHRARYGERAQSLRASQSTLLSPDLQVFTNLEALRTQSFQDFMEVFFHRRE